MTPRLVILDFDGTLADSWPWLLGALEETTRRFGLRPLSAAEAEALRGQETRAVLRALGVSHVMLPRIALHLRAAALAAPPPPLFAGIAEMLRRLSAAGVVLAIASSNGEAQIRRSLGPELAALIGHIAAEASLFGKAARLRRILRASGVAPAQALAIGDELRDIAAARAAGIAAGAVSWGYAPAATLAAARPDRLFETPEAIALFCDA